MIHRKFYKKILGIIFTFFAYAAHAQYGYDSTAIEYIYSVGISNVDVKDVATNTIIPNSCGNSKSLNIYKIVSRYKIKLPDNTFQYIDLKKFDFSFNTATPNYHTEIYHFRGFNANTPAIFNTSGCDLESRTGGIACHFDDYYVDIKFYYLYGHLNVNGSFITDSEVLLNTIEQRIQKSETDYRYLLRDKFNYTFDFKSRVEKEYVFSYNGKEYSFNIGFHKWANLIMEDYPTSFEEKDFYFEGFCSMDSVKYSAYATVCDSSILYARINSGNWSPVDTFTTYKNWQETGSTINKRYPYIYDASVDYGDRETHYEYSICCYTNCKIDSSTCNQMYVKIYRPLEYIPKEIVKPCAKGNTNSGKIKYNINQRIGSRYHSGGNWIIYWVYKDALTDGVIDPNTLVLVRTDTLKGSPSPPKNNNEIKNLSEGDYIITFNPIKYVGNGATEYQRIRESCSDFIDTIFLRGEDGPEIDLGKDKILCNNGCATLQIPYNSEITAASKITWEYSCKRGGFMDAGISKSITSNTQYNNTYNACDGGSYIVNILDNRGCIYSDTVFVADLTPPSASTIGIDAILQTSAATYSSEGMAPYSSIQWENVTALNNFYKRCSYANGTSGVFRLNQSYDYLDKRHQQINNDYEKIPDVDIREDGEILDYKFFNWSSPYFTDCFKEWVPTGKMTKYNPAGFDIENKDILGRYSAALYSYKQKLPIANAFNARYEEAGFENFEEYAVQGTTLTSENTIHHLKNATGNIDIVNSYINEDIPLKRQYEVKYAFGNYAYLDIDADEIEELSNYLGEEIEIQATSYSGDVSQAIKSVIEMSTLIEIIDTNCYDQGVIVKLSEGTPSFTCNFWQGYLTLNNKYNIAVEGILPIRYTNEVAHSGKMSAKIDASVTLPQPDLILKSNKKYVISLWIHHDSLIYKSPPQLQLYNQEHQFFVRIINDDDDEFTFYPKGNVIEGWQRIEGEFELPLGHTSISLHFDADRPIFVDDIRIYPFNGAMESYVYSPQNYRLWAKLDQNNYATFYQYDSQGNLFSVKKETEQGVKTLQLSSSYIHNNTQP